MSIRKRVGEILLWLALFFVGIIIGAEVYQRISLIPEWGGDLPGSLVRYFQGTTAAASIGRFWANVLPPTALLVVAAFVANWPDRARRKWLGVTLLFFLAALVWTEVWFVPKGVIPLMVKAGAGMTPEEITARANAWIFWDWFRMGATVVAYFSMLKALTHRAKLPI
jgi:hypothetical protein